MEHITANEMFELLNIKKPNDRFVFLVGKVNSHIALCPECAKKYRAASDLYELVEKINVLGDDLTYEALLGGCVLEKLNREDIKRIGESELHKLGFSIDNIPDVKM